MLKNELCNQRLAELHGYYQFGLMSEAPGKP
jgi:hypothetical protein